MRVNWFSFCIMELEPALFIEELEGGELFDWLLDGGKGRNYWTVTLVEDAPIPKSLVVVPATPFFCENTSKLYTPLTLI